MASKYHKKIQHILKEANLSKAQSEDLKKELESYFYEKELDLRFTGLKPDEIEKRLSEDFGDDKTISQTFQFVHSFDFFIKIIMKKIVITILIIIIGFLFWSPWMAEDGGENTIRKLQTDPEVQSKILELARQNSVRLNCDGISSTWAPFGRMLDACGGGWYVTFWGEYFYIDGE